MAAADQVVRVGVVEGIPREIAVDQDHLVGRFSPFYHCVFESLDQQFSFRQMPLAQILYQLKKGRLDVGLPLVQTEERDQYADFGGRLFQTEYVYLLLEDLPPLEQTFGLTYSFIRRFVGEQLLLGEGAKMLAVSGWKQAVDMLKLGRADVVILPWVLLDPLMADFEGQYFVRSASWVDISLYVSHSTEEKGLAEKLRASVRRCRYRNDQN
ncbi:transporter substrate-binding domain-containing protein [Marinobacter koreensis]|uniref:Transporter substrate-binding domain-containing protein n=1 Tax=Marinobacter koreensis TaxID=335974 RepID=A0ABW0RP34_9GAMM|nr:transporter substrate-binding domain-containing protein [Marinobacter koreensis]MCK7549249.1 transporter substrate-binding domain-containing protein [Marinobacter koreensis]